MGRQGVMKCFDTLPNCIDTMSLKTDICWTLKIPN